MASRKALVGLVTLAALLACKAGRSDDRKKPVVAATSTGSAASPRASLAEGGWTSNEACTLLDRAEAVAALGSDLRNVKRPDNGEQADSPLVECIYDRSPAPGFVKISIDVPSRQDDFGKGYPPATIAVTSVAGIGDAAIQSNNSSMGFILYARKGAVTFRVQAQTDDRGDKDKALVRAVAKKAADRL